MMLNSIKLKNFKCYEDETFIFENLTVFCGNNSVGKSSAIQALLLAYQNNLSSSLDLNGDLIQLGSYNDVHNQNVDPDSLSIEINYKDGKLEWGYEEDEFDSDKGVEVEEAPLPLLFEPSDLSIRNKLKSFYQDNFSFLSAERLGPRNSYPYSTQRRSPTWLGIHGEFTAQVLSNISVNDTLEEGDPRISEGAERTIADNLYAWMAEISPGIFIKSDAIKHANIAITQFQFDGHTYRATNVGFGLSYVLPVVLALLMAKTDSLVIIENPEAHLHPRGQSYLGRLIALAAQSGVQVIIETHSDHIINGIRLMVRSKDVEQKKIGFYHIYLEESLSVVKPLTLNAQGQFSEWPSSLFDQQAIDMGMLISGTIK